MHLTALLLATAAIAGYALAAPLPVAQPDPRYLLALDASGRIINIVATEIPGPTGDLVGGIGSALGGLASSKTYDDLDKVNKRSANNLRFVLFPASDEDDAEILEQTFNRVKYAKELIFDGVADLTSS